MAFDSLLAAHRKFLGSDSAEVQQHQNGGKQPAMGIPKIPLLLHYEPARIIGPAGMSRAWRLGNVPIALDFANLDGAAAQSGDIASDVSHRTDARFAHAPLTISATTWACSANLHRKPLRVLGSRLSSPACDRKFMRSDGRRLTSLERPGAAHVFRRRYRDEQMLGAQ
jgi:hypothetical protein